MKKTRFIRAFSFLVVLVVAIHSCKKADTADIKKLCRIENAISFTDRGPSPRVFTYNKWDNPVSVRFDFSETGVVDHNFYYDKHQRLIKWSSFNGHSYTYNKLGQAIIDTIHQNYAGQNEYLLEMLYYDSHNRIIKSVLTSLEASSPPAPGDAQTTYYNYDRNGNLIIPGVEYDSKISILRTNKVWMLVHKDYSVNNRLHPDITYNQFGLPLNPLYPFLEFGVTDIIYNCMQTHQSK
jgi:hypothetical protein